MRLALLWPCLFAAPVWAGEVISATVEHTAGRYLLTIDALLEASSDSVLAVLRDYGGQSRLSPTIIDSRVLSSADASSHRTRHTLESCLLFFCLRAIKVQDVVELGDGVILATVVPEDSDFDHGYARWHVRPEGERARLTYNSDLRPGFWVPPLIGPYLIQHRLREETLQSITRLEALAQQRSD